MKSPVHYTPKQMDQIQAFIQETFGSDENGMIANAGRAHQEDGPLPFSGDQIVTKAVLGKICLHGVLNLLFGLFLCS